MNNFWQNKHNERLVEAFLAPSLTNGDFQSMMNAFVEKYNPLRDRPWQIGPFVAHGRLVNPWEMTIFYVDDTTVTNRSCDVTRPEDPQAALAEARERWAARNI